MTRIEKTCDLWGHVTGENAWTETDFRRVVVCDCDLWGHPILDFSNNTRPFRPLAHGKPERGNVFEGV